MHLSINKAIVDLNLSPKPYLTQTLCFGFPPPPRTELKLCFHKAVSSGEIYQLSFASFEMLIFINERATTLDCSPPFSILQ